MTIEKLDASTSDLTRQNIERLLELFPECRTEGSREDAPSVDFDLLRQALTDYLVEGPAERYRLDWPGKRQALLTANTPIDKTLRPMREESVDFDTTRNLFIEGDNLDALKLLQETYLGKIKMIYIDPPYNTGRDFVYKDNFSVRRQDYEAGSGQRDEAGGRLVANPESNGRFHSDWLAMMFPRLKLAKNLLAEDGAIFISIDEGEKSALISLCNEIFGESALRNVLAVRRRVKSLNLQFAEAGLASFNVGLEYILVYAKSDKFLFSAIHQKKKNAPTKGTWNVFWSGADRPTMRYELMGFTPKTGQWRWSEEKALEGVANYEGYLKDDNGQSLEEYWEGTGKSKRFVRRIENGEGKNGGVQYWVPPSATSLRTSNWLDLEVSQIRKDYDLPFDNPKNVDLMIELIKACGTTDLTCLDFFAGSGTTGDAVMRLNAADGGERRFILVQAAAEMEADDTGFDTLAEISRKRLELASRRISDNGEDAGSVDTGFRAFRIDSGNFADTSVTPREATQEALAGMANHIKDDRSEEDLLFGALLRWGVDISLPIKQRELAGRTVWEVESAEDGTGRPQLLACFARPGRSGKGGIDTELADAMAELNPVKVLFRDDGFADDATMENVHSRFRQLAPDAEVKVL